MHTDVTLHTINIDVSRLSSLLLPRRLHEERSSGLIQSVCTEETWRDAGMLLTWRLRCRLPAGGEGNGTRRRAIYGCRCNRTHCSSAAHLCQSCSNDHRSNTDAASVVVVAGSDTRQTCTWECARHLHAALPLPITLGLGIRVCVDLIKCENNVLLIHKLIYITVVHRTFAWQK